MCNREVHSTSSRAGYGGDAGGFGAFCAIFRAPPVIPELSASFSSLRALTPVSARGLQGCRSRREFHSQVTRHRVCANSSQWLVDKNIPTEVRVQDNNNNSCPLAAAAVLSCRVQLDRWIAPHLAIRTLFDCCRWDCWVTQPVQRTLLWPSWLPAFDKSRGSKSVEVQRVWEFYDERLQFMSRQDASLLDDSLDAGDVSIAWLVWSRAAEAALADAFRFSGGPLPSRGLVLGGGRASFRVVKLGGHKVRKARGYAADAHSVDVFLYRDSSIAPLLDLRRRLKVVMELADVMILGVWFLAGVVLCFAL